MPASAPQPITEVAKPVITVAAIIAHFGVSLVTMIAVPATSKASAKVSSTLMPLRMRSLIGFVLSPSPSRPAGHVFERPGVLRERGVRHREGVESGAEAVLQVALGALLHAGIGLDVERERFA